MYVTEYHQTQRRAFGHNAKPAFTMQRQPVRQPRDPQTGGMSRDELRAIVAEQLG